MQNKEPKHLRRCHSIWGSDKKKPIVSGVYNVCDRIDSGSGQRLLKEEPESEKIKNDLLNSKSQVG